MIQPGKETVHRTRRTRGNQSDNGGPKITKKYSETTKQVCGNREENDKVCFSLDENMSRTVYIFEISWDLLPIFLTSSR